MRITVGQETGHREQHLGDGERRTPLVLENIQTDVSLAVDVAVVNSSLEHELQLEETYWKTSLITMSPFDIKQSITAAYLSKSNVNINVFIKDIKKH